MMKYRRQFLEIPNFDEIFDPNPTYTTKKIGHYVIRKGRARYNQAFQPKRIKLELESVIGTKLSDIKHGADLNWTEVSFESHVTDQLEWIEKRAKAKESSVPDYLSNYDFVVSRNLLAYLAETLYATARSKNFKMVAIKAENNPCVMIFQLDFERFHQHNNCLNEPFLRLQPSLRFQQISKQEGRYVDPLQESEVLVLEAKLDYLNMMVFGDACAEKPDGGQLVDMKLMPAINHYRVWRNFCRYKTRRTVVRSRFLGVKEVVLGFRNKTNCVEHIGSYNLEQLEKVAIFWSSGRSIACVKYLLKEMRTVMESKDFRSGDGITMVTFDFDPTSKKMNYSPPLDDSLKFLKRLASRYLQGRLRACSD